MIVNIFFKIFFFSFTEIKYVHFFRLFFIFEKALKANVSKQYDCSKREMTIITGTSYTVKLSSTYFYFLFLLYKGVFPTWWMSDDGRHLLVPPGEATYMSHKTASAFGVHGNITPDWLEYDVARMPLLYCSEYKLHS